MDDPWPQTWPEVTELHVFDPEGDVLLIFERYLEEDGLVEPVDEGKRELVPEGGFVSEKRGSRVEDEVPQPSPNISERPELGPESVPCKPQAESHGDGVDGMMEPGGPATASLASQEMERGIEKVQMRVSSKHLILASGTFRSSLGSDTYSEGRILQTKGNLVIPLPDEDPDAMIILLNIIHGLSRRVPRRVDLNMLCRLAVAVNHRQLHQAVELWSDTWIENLKRDTGLPGSYTPERLLSWLFISWVFRKDEDFRNMSAILGRESDDLLESELETVYVGPYIPASIIRTIQENRRVVVERMISAIHNFITSYSGPNILCDKGGGLPCDAAILGSLVKASAVIGIWPRPKNPYPGIDPKTLASQIREMTIYDLCPYSPVNACRNSHYVRFLIDALVGNAEDSIVGLQLSSFLPQKGRRSKKGER